MIRTLFWVGLLLLGGPAFGQITIPESVPKGTELTATVQANVPPGATFDGGWSISCDDGCPATYRELKEPNAIGIWSTKVGVYSITYSGYWVLVGPEITVVDVDGVEQKFQPYLGSGRVSETAIFEITGVDDDDGDDDDGDDDTVAAWGLILEETGDRTSEWNNRVRALRAEFDRMDYRLLIMDETKLPSSLTDIKNYVDASGLDLPVLVAASDEGVAIKVVECPDSVDGVKEELGL